MPLVGPESQPTCTSTLHTTLLELERVADRLETLRQSSQSLTRTSIDDHQRCSADFAAQVDALEGYRQEVRSIDSLSSTLRAEQDKVDDYQSKLEQIQVKIDHQREVEEEWRRRTSREFSNGPDSTIA